MYHITLSLMLLSTSMTTASTLLSSTYLGCYRDIGTFGKLVASGNISMSQCLLECDNVEKRGSLINSTLCAYGSVNGGKNSSMCVSGSVSGDGWRNGGATGDDKCNLCTAGSPFTGTSCGGMGGNFSVYMIGKGSNATMTYIGAKNTVLSDEAMDSRANKRIGCFRDDASNVTMKLIGFDKGVAGCFSLCRSMNSVHCGIGFGGRGCYAGEATEEWKKSMVANDTECRISPRFSDDLQLENGGFNETTGQIFVSLYQMATAKITKADGGGGAGLPWIFVCVAAFFLALLGAMTCFCHLQKRKSSVKKATPIYQVRDNAMNGLGYASSAW